MLSCSIMRSFLRLSIKKILQVNFSFKLRIYSTISQLLHEIILLHGMDHCYNFCSLRPPQRHSFFYWLIHLERLNWRNYFVSQFNCFIFFFLSEVVCLYMYRNIFSSSRSSALFIVVYVIKKRVMRLIVCEDQIVIVYDSFWALYIRINVWRCL